MVDTIPAGVERGREAGRARRRLCPVSVLYSAFAVAVMVRAAPSHPSLALASFALGVLVWTAVEYAVHRYILHGRFPDGPGVLEHFLHKYFDHLHWEHHKRPWDGNHINGTIQDTLPFVGPIVLLSFLFPFATLPALLAGFLQAYIVEEWVHHSVHFCEFQGRYFRYIKRHHLYHHSPKGSAVAYGLSNGLWDAAYDTRISPEMRRGPSPPPREVPPPPPPPASAPRAPRPR